MVGGRRRADRSASRQWSNHDYDTARNGLAPDVRVTATRTQPMPPTTDLTGTDDYMGGLTQFAQAVVPGSLRFSPASATSATRCSC